MKLRLRRKARLLQIARCEPPHSCGGARLSSRAARVGLFSSGFSRGVLKPGLKPDRSKCDSFRDAEASLPLLKQGAPHRQQPTLRFLFTHSKASPRCHPQLRPRSALLRRKACTASVGEPVWKSVAFAARPGPDRSGRREKCRL